MAVTHIGDFAYAHAAGGSLGWISFGLTTPRRTGAGVVNRIQMLRRRTTRIKRMKSENEILKAKIEELKDLLSSATARISELKLALISVELSGRRLLELEVFQNRIDDALNKLD